MHLLIYIKFIFLSWNRKLDFPHTCLLATNLNRASFVGQHLSLEYWSKLRKTWPLFTELPIHLCIMTMHLKPADRFSGSGSLGYVYNMNIKHHEAETLTDKNKKSFNFCVQTNSGATIRKLELFSNNFLLLSAEGNNYSKNFLFTLYPLYTSVKPTFQFKTKLIQIARF